MDWGIVTSIILGSIAVALAVVTIYLIRRKKPVWAYTTTKIIGLGTDAPAELKLFFNEKRVLEVYRTEFIFFNMGNTSIRKDDVSDPITVQFKGAEFLRDPYAMQINRQENRINIIVDRDSSTFEVDFLFLDHRDGVIVEVMHDKSAEVECKGNIIDAGKPRYLGEFERRPPEGYKGNMIAGLLFGGLIAAMWVQTAPNIIRNSIDWVALGMLTVFTIGFSYILIRLIQRFYKFFRFPLWSRIDARKKSVM